MQHLLNLWSEIKPVLSERRIVLFLDYDGTLTPIVESPPLARLSAEVKKVLQGISRTDGINTTIVSGRSLAEVKRRVGIPGFVYIGNHGLELEGPSVRFVHPEAKRSKKLFAKLTGRLKQAFKPFRGVWVENKTFTVSVHYRRLNEAKLDAAKVVFLKVLKPYLNSSQLILREGKKVWELRPPTQWHKGTAVLWLLARVVARTSDRPLPIYVGDDQTDEDGFRAVKGKGFGVKVTEEESNFTEARYYLRSPKEVLEFLKRLKAMKGGKEGSRVRIRTAQGA